MMAEYKRPNVTADIIIPDSKGRILLIRRKNQPFRGYWALPGGFMDVGRETVEDCARREALEETNLKIELTGLLGVWSKPDRDPRWHTVTCVFAAEPVSEEAAGQARGLDDAAECSWFDPHTAVFEKLDLAFDHREILKAYLRQQIQPG